MLERRVGTEMAHWTIGPGDWCHIELLTGDRDRAKRFYGSVFGWEMEDIPGADYTMVRTSEDGIEGGIGLWKRRPCDQGPLAAPGAPRRLGSVRRRSS